MKSHIRGRCFTETAVLFFAVLSKTTPAVSLQSKSGATLSVVNKGGSQPSQVAIVSRPALVQSSASQQPVPRPLIKLSAGIYSMQLFSRAFNSCVAWISS